jgi:hypothetical protein
MRNLLVRFEDGWGQDRGNTILLLDLNDEKEI